MNEKLLEEQIKNLSSQVEKGFKGVHQRQDIANGRLAENEKKVEKLEKVDIRFEGKLDALTKSELDHIKSTNKWTDYAVQIVINALLVLAVAVLIKTGILTL